LHLFYHDKALVSTDLPEFMKIFHSPHTGSGDENTYGLENGGGNAVSNRRDEKRRPEGRLFAI
jgi:hypothetical protein